MFMGSPGQCYLAVNHLILKYFKTKVHKCFEASWNSVESAQMIVIKIKSDYKKK